MIQRWMCWVYAIALVRIKIGCLIDVEKIRSLCVCGYARVYFVVVPNTRQN